MHLTHPPLRAEGARLSEARLRRALDRYGKLRPHLEQDVPLARVAAQAGMPLRTAQRWVSRYRRFGLAGLSRAARADRGKRRRLSDELRGLVEALALRKPPLTPGVIYREVCRIARSEGREPPGYHTIYNVIRALSKAPASLVADREKVYCGAHDVVQHREAERPNQIWHAGHTQVDLWARRDDGKPARPWLTVIIDDYSRTVAGFFFSFDRPSALHTSLALRQAIWRKPDGHWIIFGIPEILYTNNVRDFTSASLERVAADLNIRLMFSVPGYPRGRSRIKRFLETVNRTFLAGLPGSIVPGADPGEPSLTLSELDRRLREFLREYHACPHTETKIPPQARWQHGGFAPRRAESLDQLDLLLLTVAKGRKIQPDGIRFQGTRYIDPVLAAYIGETVLLRYDPRDLGEVRLFHREKLLCRAVRSKLACQTIASGNT